VAHAWRHADDLIVIAANLADGEAQGLVQLGALADAPAFSFVDQLSDVRYRWDREELRRGLYVRLASGRAHVFDVRTL
jgi:hypothetical protein